jgi:hypothetical protein
MYILLLPQKSDGEFCGARNAKVLELWLSPVQILQIRLERANQFDLQLTMEKKFN